MRRDINQRFLETKRRHKKGQFPRRIKPFIKADEDGRTDCPTGMKRPHVIAGDSDYGGVGDWGILDRFLTSRIGKDWDEVYSEICTDTDARSWPGHKLREAIDHLVEQNCTIDEDGTIRDDRGYELLSWRRHSFYIHPEKRTLEAAQRNRRWHKEELKQTVFEMDGQLYHCHEGIWFRVEMKPIPTTSERGYNVYSMWFTDVFGANSEPKTLEERRYWNWWGWQNMIRRKYGLSPEGKAWYAASKQSANSKEIAKLKKKHNLD